MSKPVSKNNKKRMQRGGDCRSYWTDPAAAAPLPAAGAPPLAITNLYVREVFNNVMNPLYVNVNDVITQFVAVVRRDIFLLASTTVAFYRAVADLARYGAAGIEQPSSYIRAIATRIEYNNTFIGNILAIITTTQRLVTEQHNYASAAIGAIGVGADGELADQATLVPFKLWRRKYFNLCKQLSLCIKHISTQVQFLNQVANIYCGSCDVLEAVAVPPRLDAVVPILEANDNDKWTVDHMRDNANIDYNNALASAANPAAIHVIITAYKTALDTASAPGSLLIGDARKLCKTGLEIVTTINTNIQDVRVVNVYNKVFTGDPDVIAVLSYDVTIPLIQPIIGILQSINENILYNNARAPALDAAAKTAAIRLYNYARNVVAAEAAGAAAAGAGAAYNAAFDASNVQFNTDHPDLVDRPTNIPVKLRELKEANIALVDNINAVVHMVGGTRRHKKSLSLKKNKMHKRTKQNHKSRKTYNTHNTRNTQQRKKHNKQKSHKNKHM